MIAATIALCALGHLNRDGWPILGSTHAARALGGFLCTLGGFLLTFEWQTTLLGIALYAGFYSDMQHGEGHRARGWLDVVSLIISGCTSLLPLGITAILINPFYGLVVFAGIVKPLIWFTAWRLPAICIFCKLPPVTWSDDEQGIWQPTRVAAITWGAFVGGLLSIA